jgi:hypothetical protein
MSGPTRFSARRLAGSTLRGRPCAEKNSHVLVQQTEPSSQPVYVAVADPVSSRGLGPAPARCWAPELAMSEKAENEDVVTDTLKTAKRVLRRARSTRVISYRNASNAACSVPFHARRTHAFAHAARVEVTTSVTRKRDEPTVLARGAAKAGEASATRTVASAMPRTSA